MPRWLRLGLECIRDNDESEVGFPGDSALHGFMVGVHVRVVVDFQERWLQCFGELSFISKPSAADTDYITGITTSVPWLERRLPWEFESLSMRISWSRKLLHGTSNVPAKVEILAPVAVVTALLLPRPSSSREYLSFESAGNGLCCAQVAKCNEL